MAIFSSLCCNSRQRATEVHEVGGTGTLRGDSQPLDRVMADYSFDRKIILSIYTEVGYILSSFLEGSRLGRFNIFIYTHSKKQNFYLVYSLVGG